MILSFFFFSSRRRHTRFDCDWSSDVCSSDLHPGVMLLEADVPLGIAAVVRVRGELARLDPRLPVRTAELVLNDFDTVEPVLDVVPVHDEADLVPLTRGLHDAGGRGMQPVVRSGRGEARLADRKSTRLNSSHSQIS